MTFNAEELRTLQQRWQAEAEAKYQALQKQLKQYNGVIRPNPIDMSGVEVKLEYAAKMWNRNYQEFDGELSDDVIKQLIHRGFTVLLCFAETHEMFPVVKEVQGWFGSTHYKRTYESRTHRQYITVVTWGSENIETYHIFRTYRLDNNDNLVKTDIR